MVKRNEYYDHFVVVFVCNMWINMKKNGGCMWFQEEPRVEDNNNRETQAGRSKQVGTWYLYLLYLIIIFVTNYLTIRYKLVLSDEGKERGKRKDRGWKNGYICV